MAAKTAAADHHSWAMNLAQVRLLVDPVRPRCQFLSPSQGKMQIVPWRLPFAINGRTDWRIELARGFATDPGRAIWLQEVGAPSNCRTPEEAPGKMNCKNATLQLQCAHGFTLRSPTCLGANVLPFAMVIQVRKPSQRRLFLLQRGYRQQECLAVRHVDPGEW